ncbi:molecular chaperone [Lelliottia aquatilis]|uniref:fimbrial biogenesis chaperone n=1 Tax=Lelliottia aquatilis TaxID=2080838 RepID=UPI0015758D82|nr:molecular chaperone [Lelliottia aquatilis]NTZ45473.1 molecular chaperone [Lelliottia aquatilis]
MKKNRVPGLRGLLLLLALAMSLPGQAFVLGGTRVVLNEPDGATIPVISKPEDNVLLIQARVVKTREGKGKVTDVMVSPPVSRLEPGGRNSLKLMMLNSSAFPRDRESLFYLSVAGLPSSNPLSPDRGKITGGVVVGTGVIVKVFWRPKSLPVVSDSTWSSLVVTRVPGGIDIRNPTPFHINFQSLKVDGHQIKFSDAQPEMLLPFAHQFYGTSSVAKKTLQWTVYNDLGGLVNGQSDIR